MIVARPKKESTMNAVYLRLTLTALMWAGMFHAGQYVVASMSPLAAAAWRFALAGLIFLPLVAWREGWSLPGLRRNALVLIVMSVVGVFGFNMGLFYGLQATSAVNGALIVGVNPALTAVLAALVNRKLPSTAQVAGLVLGLVGVVVVVSHGSWATLAGLHVASGDAFVLLGALCWAIYTALPQRYIKGLSSVQVAASTVIGGGLLIVGFAATSAPDFVQMPSLPILAAIGFMGIFGSVLAYLWWNDGIKVVGPTQAAICMNFVPLFATLIGLLRGQSVSAAQWGGAVLVVSGVLVSALWKKPLAALPVAPVNTPLCKA
ncbi:MAG: DMT family transporter [Rubrivivax sp.]|nr:MAG: DMT family transporter [Rubrivivax sp.]